MTEKPSIPGDLGNVEASGIVRQIDDLGRVVIPKEIRRVLGITPMGRLEIFASEKAGLVVMRKYGEMGTACIGCGRTFGYEFGDCTKSAATLGRGGICVDCVRSLREVETR